MQKTTKIICSIVLGCIVLGCIIGIIKTSKLTNKILSETVFLENAKIKTENEGKLVVAKSVIKCESDLVDDSLGVTVKSPYLKRLAETKQIINKYNYKN